MSRVIDVCIVRSHQEPEDTMSPDTYFKTATQLGLWTQGYYDMLDSDGIVATNADDNVDKCVGRTYDGTAHSRLLLQDGTGALCAESIIILSTRRDESVSAPYDAEKLFFQGLLYFVKVRRFGDVPIIPGT